MSQKCPALQHYTPGELGKLANRNAMDLERLGWSTFLLQLNIPPPLTHPSIASNIPLCNTLPIWLPQGPLPSSTISFHFQSNTPFDTLTSHPPPTSHHPFSTTYHIIPMSQKRPALQHYTPGELGKLANRNAMDLERLGWSTFFASAQHPTSINPSIHSLQHPTVQYLTHLASTGPPAIFNPPMDPPLGGIRLPQGPTPLGRHSICFLSFGGHV